MIEPGHDIAERLHQPRVALVRRLFQHMESNELGRAADELLANSAEDVVFEPHAAHGREIRGHEELREFWSRFESEGRSYLTVAVGCTGGRHRSVVMAGEIARLLGERLGISGDLVHRDLDRVNMSGPGGDPDHGPPIASGGRNA